MPAKLLASIAIAVTMALPMSSQVAARQQPLLVPEAVRVDAEVMARRLDHKVDPIPFGVNTGPPSITGTVELLALIDQSGKVQKLKVLSGPDVFKHSVLLAVRQWHYDPYLDHGKPVAVQTTIAVPCHGWLLGP